MSSALHIPLRLLRGTDDVLRGRWAQLPSGAFQTSVWLLGCIIVFGVAYGAVMGAYGGMRPLQMLYSALKLPLLLLVTFALALPSFFVVNTLLGVRQDFPQVLRALLATQAALTVILASLAPLTAVWYLSSEQHRAAVVFNGVVFLAASTAAQSSLRRYYRPLIAARPVHRRLLRGWLLLYAFVAIQMAWVLRPFIGDPNLPTTFFREGAWGNAYVQVGRLVWSLFVR